MMMMMVMNVQYTSEASSVLFALASNGLTVR